MDRPVRLLYREGYPGIPRLFQQQKHCLQQSAPDSIAAERFADREGERWSVIVEVSVIVHEPAPDHADNFGAAFRNQPQIARPGAEIRKVDLQFRAVHHASRRRRHTFRDEDRFVQKLL